MAAYHPISPIVATRPSPPDFHTCDPFYGTDIKYSDCLAAWSRLPVGSQMTRYAINGPGPFGLPYSTGVGQSSSHSLFLTIDPEG